MVTEWPALARYAPAVNPDMPEPMMITFTGASKTISGYHDTFSAASFLSANSFTKAVWFLRVMGYQIRNGRLIRMTTAGTTAKKKRMPNNARVVWTAFGT